MRELTWTGLGPAQADGRACVICGHNFRTRGSVCVPVGRSSTGSQVFACLGSCAEQAQPSGGVALPVSMEALTAAGAAFEALDREGGDLQRAYPDDLVVATVWAAAPLIVAAALRRLADGIDPAIGPPESAASTQQVHESWADYLRVRADELDPAGGERR